MIKRFVADWALVVDITFNINRRRHLFLIGTDISNTDMIFSVVYQLILSESAETFGWFFQCLDDYVFNDAVLSSLTKPRT